MSAFSERLIAWQRRDGRHGLPWQGTRDPYRVWLSEIMLQQTQVKTVLEYYPRFLARFADVAALAAAPESDVMALWSGLAITREPAISTAALKRWCPDLEDSFPPVPISCKHCLALVGLQRRPSLRSALASAQPFWTVTSSVC